MKMRPDARTASSLRRQLILAGIGVVAAPAVALMPRAKLPQVGDHWHAGYLVVICGRPVPDMPLTRGAIHTQGDGVIHVEPKTRAEAGRNANLGRFFATAGVTFVRDQIAFPTGQIYRDGDRCPDGTTGHIRLLATGRPHHAFEHYVPSDGDTIVVQFGSYNADPHHPDSDGHPGRAGRIVRTR